MRKVIFAVFFLAVAFQAAAQSTAFRYILGETNRIYDTPKFDNYCMGLGVDRSFNNKLTVGFDISYDIGNALRTDPPYTTFTSGGIDASYTMKPGLLTMNYHTEFAPEVVHFLLPRNIPTGWCLSVCGWVYAELRMAALWTCTWL